MSIENAEFVDMSNGSDAPEEVCPIAVGIAEGLRSSMQALFDGLPGRPIRPTEISRLIGVSRVMVSRTASSIKKEAPIETLTSIPGPESLRSMVNGALEVGTPKEISACALEAIDRFDSLIRERFGTRSALNAALSTQSAESLDRFEQTSRYEVFKGMGKVLGAQAETMLSCLMMLPRDDDPDGIDGIIFSGLTGFQRLRSDLDIRFSYGGLPDIEIDIENVDQHQVSLEDLYTHKPAPLNVSRIEGEIVHTLSTNETGKNAKYDMLTVIESPNISRRFAEGARTKRGVSVIPDYPVQSLIIDLMVYGDLFEGNQPDLRIYHLTARGAANPDDLTRDIDLVPCNTPDALRSLGAGLEPLEVPDIPNYPKMIERITDQHGVDASQLRTYRLVIPYPVIGFQYLILFSVPYKPDTQPG